MEWDDDMCEWDNIYKRGDIYKREDDGIQQRNRARWKADRKPKIKMDPTRLRGDTDFDMMAFEDTLADPQEVDDVIDSRREGGEPSAATKGTVTKGGGEPSVLYGSIIDSDVVEQRQAKQWERKMSVRGIFGCID